MKHDDIRHKLSEFIDGAVAPDEKATIEQHLKTCTECSEALRELRKTVEHIHAVEEVEAPAWMTQKIMATVRAEQEAKKRLLQRVFAPILVKFPVQAVAVLFLSVTVFYIYMTMHPTDKYTEAPTERSAKQEAEDSLRDAQKQKAPEIAERREKKVAQKPDYKSLDMKYEYEKPAEPAREEGPARGAAAAPAPASKMPEQQPAPAPEPAKKKAYIAKDEADLGKVAAAPKAAAPSVMMEQAAPAPGAASKHADKLMLKSQIIKKDPPFDSCLNYEPTVSTLAGVITKVDFPGPSEYQDISKGDKKETYWILKLNKPFCVRGKEGDTLNVTEAKITEVQLVLGSMLYDKYRSLMDKPVTAKGTLFHAITIHHHTQVLLQVQSIELLVK